WPVGPVGKPTEFHLMYPLLAMSYTKYPQACKALMAYMLEADQFNKWLEASQGYLTHCLNAYDSNPVWTADPKRTIFGEAGKRTLTAGGLGSVGEKAATAIADFLVLDLFANYCTGSAWERLKINRYWLGFWFMLPALAILVLFLAYPLGLGVWLSFTEARIGRSGDFVGLENYEWLWDDSVFWLSVFNTLLYTSVASVFKFAVGLYLALLLNENLPFKAMLRAMVLIPFIVPTVLSALAFWWIFDAQFSIISWSLKQLGLITQNINFLGDANWARASVIFA